MSIFTVRIYDWWNEDDNYVSPPPTHSTSVVDGWKIMPAPTPSFITSKEGLISRIKDFVQFQTNGTSSADYKKVFDHYAKDGKIDRAALGQVLQDAYAAAPGLLGGTDRTVNDVLAAMDKNGDQALDWNEFSSGVHLSSPDHGDRS